MKNDLTTGAWQHDIGCPISITLLSTSDAASDDARDVGCQQSQLQAPVKEDSGICQDQCSEPAE